MPSPSPAGSVQMATNSPDRVVQKLLPQFQMLSAAPICLAPLLEMRYHIGEVGKINVRSHLWCPDAQPNLFDYAGAGGQMPHLMPMLQEVIGKS